MKHKLKKLSAIILAVLCICLTTAISALAFPPSDSTIYQGIDVSKWQGAIDFNQVRDSGIQVVYIRSSYGTNQDPYFRRNYEGAKAAGLKVGFYHNVTATTVAEAQRQARYFLSVIAGTSPDCRLAMDFETFDGLSAQEVNAISLAFMEVMTEESGLPGVVYANTYTARTILSPGLAQQYPLWVAHYGVSQPGDNGKWRSWIGWQYTSTGRVPGISGNVDRDQFTRDIFLDGATPVPSPSDPEPTTPDCTRIQVTVRRGDTLSAIAARYGTTVADLVQLNNIANPNLIYPGQVLTVRCHNQNPAGTAYLDYTVRRGDTLSTIAARYGTTVRSILSLNTIANPNLIYPGEVLKLQISTTGSQDEQATWYTVRWGDTLSAIAQRFSTTVSAIAFLNRIADPNRIYAGESLLIPGPGGIELYPTYEAYEVKAGDTLSAIAARYGTTVTEIAAANGIRNPSLIRVGQILEIPLAD